MPFRRFFRRQNIQPTTTENIGVFANGHGHHPFMLKNQISYEFEKPKRWFNCCALSVRTTRLIRYAAEDWLFLALLGILMAVCSLSMDVTIEFLQSWHISVIRWTNSNVVDGTANIAATYFVWTIYAVALVVLSAFSVRMIAPQAIGSGIPEMKTILRGVILKEYLTIRTLISKMVGLTLSLGSGMPIGKEGPFVHIASVMASQLSRLAQTFHGPYANESRNSEMLAAACAVGVSSTFSAPVGGVLFSIEVTSAYFAVRNYWRGFFAATCSATVFRVLRVMYATEVTVTAFYQTNFPREAFFPEELPVFAFIGVLCGFLSAAFIRIQREMVLFLRGNRIAKILFQKHWIIYPALISLLLGSLTYPKGFGRFLGGEKKFSQTAKDFFAVCTWTATENSTMICDQSLLDTWTGGPGDDFSVFVTLSTFITTYFFLSAVASTLPIPSGIFGPSFVFGAAVGRLVGEVMATIYPNGLQDDPNDIQIYPGVYAVVGAAAFCGGVTHTVSVAVIVFELTGQLLHILPVMIAVLIANAISSYLQPSIYDSMIKIKHLPFLPDIPHTSSIFHGIRVKQFMTRKVHFLSRSATYADVQRSLADCPHLKALPIVENEESRILIGSCSRVRLLRSLDALLGERTRKAEARCRRHLTRRDAFTGAKNRERERSSQVDRPEFEDRDDEEGLVETEAVNNDDEQGKGTANKRSEFEPDLHGRESAYKLEAKASIARSATFVARDIYDWHSNKPSSIRKEKKLSDFERTERRRRSLTAPVNLEVPSLNASSSTGDVQAQSTIGGIVRTLSRLSVGRLRKLSTSNTDCDLYGTERERWVAEQLAREIDLEAVGVDPAPFQLVEQSSLFKVHSLFSLLGLSRAYVTKCGRLVGVVALRDLRLAIEKGQNGELTAHTPLPHTTISGDSFASACESVTNLSVLGIGTVDFGKPGSDGRRPSMNSTINDVDEAYNAQNDILNPMIKVISGVNTTVDSDLEDADEHQRKKSRRTSEAIKAAGLFTKGLLNGRKSLDLGVSDKSNKEGNKAGTSWLASLSLKRPLAVATIAEEGQMSPSSSPGSDSSNTTSTTTSSANASSRPPPIFVITDYDEGNGESTASSHQSLPTNSPDKIPPETWSVSSRLTKTSPDSTRGEKSHESPNLDEVRIQME